jgi:hypothetical protein
MTNTDPAAAPFTWETPPERCPACGNKPAHGIYASSTRIEFECGQACMLSSERKQWELSSNFHCRNAFDAAVSLRADLAAAQAERDEWQRKEAICAAHLRGALDRETEIADTADTYRNRALALVRRSYQRAEAVEFHKAEAAQARDWGDRRASALAADNARLEQRWHAAETRVGALAGLLEKTRNYVDGFRRSCVVEWMDNERAEVVALLLAEIDAALAGAAKGAGQETGK